jgi:hypothetical protein
VLVPALVLVLDLLAAPSASAAVACSFDAGTGVATITFADGDDVTIVRSGDDIVVNGAACTGATVTATETVHVAESEPDGDDLASLTIDLSGGPLAPGKTDEGDGSSEIELTLGDAYGWIALEQMIVVGSRQRHDLRRPHPARSSVPDRPQRRRGHARLGRDRRPDVAV